MLHKTSQGLVSRHFLQGRRGWLLVLRVGHETLGGSEQSCVTTHVGLGQLLLAARVSVVGVSALVAARYLSLRLMVQ